MWIKSLLNGILCGCTLILGFLSGNSQIILISIFITCIFLYQMIATFILSRKLIIDIESPSRMNIKDKDFYQIKILNPTIFTVFRLDIKIMQTNKFTKEKYESIARCEIGPRKRVTIAKEIFSESYGCCQITIDQIVLTDIFGIIHYKLESIVLSETIIAPSDIKRLELWNQESTSLEYEYYYKSDEIKDLKVYEPGDNIREIHWKLSAKLDYLLLKRYELENNKTIQIAYETNILSEAKQPTIRGLNESIEKLIGTVEYFFAHEYIVTVYWYEPSSKRMVSIEVENHDDFEEFINSFLKVSREKSQFITMNMIADIYNVEWNQLIYISPYQEL